MSAAEQTYNYTAAAQVQTVFVNEQRTVLVRLWPSGAVEVATRPDPYATWGPPVVCKEER